MNLQKSWSLKLLAMLALTGAALPTLASEQVLAKVGPMPVMASELDSALASSPFASKLPAMGRDDQASLRGDMLRRLVVSRLLLQEAQRIGIDRQAGFRRDVDEFRLGLLYRAYMDKLRQDIVIPDDTLAAMKTQFKDDRDGLAAAKSAYVSGRYQALKGGAMQALLKADEVRLHEDRLAGGAVPDTVVAEGKHLRVRYADLLNDDERAKPPAQAELAGRLQQRVEMLAAANAAANRGVDVDARVKAYERERLPAALMEIKTKEWIPNEKALRDWYDQHPQAATVPERRHIGQLVTATRQEAEALRARIVKGESLFVLAGKYSVEPISKKQNGDVGWVIDNRGVPELEQALDKLKDGETSPVVATSDGRFHILTVLERVRGHKEDYAAVRERVAQSIVNERLPAYVSELERRYPVTWSVLSASEKPALH